MNDLDLVNDNLKKCDHSCEETLSTVGDVDCRAECLGAKSFRSGSPKKLPKNDSSTDSCMAPKEKGRMRDGAIPVAPMKKESDGHRGDRQQWTSKVSCSGGAKVRSSTMTNVKERVKSDKKDSPLQNQKSATGQSQARQEKKVNLLLSVSKKVAAKK